jgi:transposase
MITMKDYITVHKARKQGLSITGTAMKLGKDRKTIRKYLRMDKDQFLRYLERMAERGKVYEVYKDDIVEIFRNHEGRRVYTSSIHDYLTERYGELPGSDRTLRNYLCYLKASGAIETASGREYRPVAELAYGKQAQIDFGVETTNIGKAWFVAVVLSRSRYRYAAPQDRPFTTADVIDHILDAFEFFGGVPEELVLDQDRTMIVAENLGELATTKAFTTFVAEQGFTLRVCRAADPESKGKIENGVKYVKTSFFSSRSFASFDELNAGMRRWLLRANGHISQATRLVPLVDFEEREKPALRPMRASLFRPSAASAVREGRKADQRSLISVAATRYSVPSAFRLKNVEIERKDGLILVFDPKTGTQIAAHRAAQLPGGTIINKSHYHDREASLEVLHNNLVDQFPDLPEWKVFVDSIYAEYRRYFRDHARGLSKLIERKPNRERLTAALRFCIERGLASARDLLAALETNEREDAAALPGTTITSTTLKRSRRPVPIVAKRPLSAYQTALDKAGRNAEGAL